MHQWPVGDTNALLAIWGSQEIQEKFLQLSQRMPMCHGQWTSSKSCERSNRDCKSKSSAGRCKSQVGLNCALMGPSDRPANGGIKFCDCQAKVNVHTDGWIWC